MSIITIYGREFFYIFFFLKDCSQISWKMKWKNEWKKSDYFIREAYNSSQEAGASNTES